MKSVDTISRWQEICLGFLCLLSPIIRILPREMAMTAGPYAWLSAAASALPLIFIFFVLNRLFKNALPGEGFAELFVKALGTVPGKLMIMAFTVWLAFYSSFTLSTVADRYVSTAYQNSSPVFFMAVLAFIALAAALGSFRSLARTAEVCFPPVAIIIAATFMLAAPDINREYLPPFTVASAPEVLAGMPFSTEVLGIAVYFGFMEGRVRDKEKRKGTMLISSLLMLTVVILLCVTTIGVFGAEFISRASFPYFAMVSSLSLFNLLYRLEAFILSVWVVMDFIIVATGLFIIGGNLRFCFGFPAKNDERTRFFDMKNGRWITCLTAAAVLACALALTPNSFDIARLANKIVPFIHLIFIFGLIPLTALIGVIRKKI